ncbi:MAG: UDP-N-acetylglucosamine 1-carboxyvinyltransferase, partial [Oscillospiraceae bacterium]|nr:UDP-N-acetylglucosamine 1-carboxyvinyltransferase [Oscillospiraceae bacterium]
MEQIHRPVRLMVEGGRRLDGAVTVHGAKNSVLPILAAALLAKTGPDGSGGVSEIENCPELSDVRVACDILRHLGCTVTVQGDLIRVEAGGLCRSDIPDDLMSGMRSSIVFLGAVIARAGEARMTYPGGCDLGPRPIDLHLSSLERLGVEISERHGVYHCRAPKRLRGATVILPIPSVGATENILLAAVTAEGVTVIRNAAREPEVADLCRYLIACGADIRG